MQHRVILLVHWDSGNTTEESKIRRGVWYSCFDAIKLRESKLNRFKQTRHSLESKLDPTRNIRFAWRRCTGKCFSTLDMSIHNASWNGRCRIFVCSFRLMHYVCVHIKTDRDALSSSLLTEIWTGSSQTQLPTLDPLFLYSFVGLSTPSLIFIPSSLDISPDTKEVLACKNLDLLVCCA
jgi:hypothetical protein